MDAEIGRRELLKSCSVAGFAGLAGCIDSDDEVIELGLLMDLTGRLRPLGARIRDAAELVARDINDANTDFQVTVQAEDTAGSSETAVERAERLIEEDVQMIVGPLSSDVSIEFAKLVSIQQEIVQVSPSSTAPQYSRLEGDWTFRTAPSDEYQARVVADVATGKFEAETAAVVFQDDAYGQGLSDAVIETFNTDGEVVASRPFEVGANEYEPVLQQALAANPEMLILVSHPVDGITLCTELFQEIDPDVPVVVSDGLQLPELPARAGFGTDRVTGTAPQGQGPGRTTFRERYRTYYDTNPDQYPFTREAYDAAAVLVLAAVVAPTTEGPAIRDALRSVTTPHNGETVTPETLANGIELAAANEDIIYEGASGPIVFDEQGDVETARYRYFGFDDGGIVPLDSFVLN